MAAWSHLHYWVSVSGNQPKKNSLVTTSGLDGNGRNTSGQGIRTRLPAPLTWIASNLQRAKRTRLLCLTLSLLEPAKRSDRHQGWYLCAVVDWSLVKYGSSCGPRCVLWMGVKQRLFVRHLVDTQMITNLRYFPHENKELSSCSRLSTVFNG